LLVGSGTVVRAADRWMACGLSLNRIIFDSASLLVADFAAVAGYLYIVRVQESFVAVAQAETKLWTKQNV
jgi:hypothetical protein